MRGKDEAKGKVELSLLFEENGTGHDDLVLRFAGRSWRCDSYYLVLDGERLPGPDDARKTHLILQRLLEQWLEAVESVLPSGAVYLPYDFSDQYTGWLRCSRSEDMADVCRGWAEVEGWKIMPSAVGQHLAQLPGFRPEGPAVQVSMRELIETIHRMVTQRV